MHHNSYNCQNYTLPHLSLRLEQHWGHICLAQSACPTYLQGYLNLLGTVHCAIVIGLASCKSSSSR